MGEPGAEVVVLDNTDAAIGGIQVKKVFCFSSPCWRIL
jgi:hypothetical protein